MSRCDLRQNFPNPVLIANRVGCVGQRMFESGAVEVPNTSECLGSGCQKRSLSTGVDEAQCTSSVHRSDCSGIDGTCRCEIEELRQCSLECRSIDVVQTMDCRDTQLILYELLHVRHGQVGAVG